MNYEIFDDIAGRVIISVDDYTEIRLSTLHNKIEVWDFDFHQHKMTFKKDFTNFVVAFQYAKDIVNGAEQC